MFGAVSKEHMGSGMVYLFTYDVFNYMHSKGIKVFYGRYSSAKSYRLLLNYGGEVTSKV